MGMSNFYCVIRKCKSTGRSGRCLDGGRVGKCFIDGSGGRCFTTIACGYKRLFSGRLQIIAGEPGTERERERQLVELQYFYHTRVFSKWSE